MKLNIFKSTVVSIEEDSYCVKKLVLLSFLTAMVICVKFLLGNIAGVEIVSFLLCLYTLYFYLRDSIFIVTIFNLSIMLLYGFCRNHIHMTTFCFLQIFRGCFLLAVIFCIECDNKSYIVGNKNTVGICNSCDEKGG